MIAATSLPLPSPFYVWRIDRQRHASEWNSGVGAMKSGGRWNPKGFAAVYCSMDPSTAILEVAVHKGFEVLDAEPHVLTRVEILTPSRAHIVRPDDLPNPNWAIPGSPTLAQQRFGSSLLQEHGMILIPSVVSRHCWNLVFAPSAAASLYALDDQERLSIDPRLAPRPN